MALDEFQKDVIERLARMETKLNNVINSSKDQEKRLRSTEKKLYWFSGAWAVVVIVMSWAVRKLF